MGRRPNPTPPRAPNPIANLKPIRNAPPIARPGVSLAQQAAKRAAGAKAKARLCPNKTCDNPKVEDGICHNCGTIVDDSNIVSEIQFGESSSGAAVVQGSFISADQGAAKSLGPAFRRAGGSEDKEATIRNGKRDLQNLGSQMEIPESIVNSAVQIFKLCSLSNFIQGRRLEMVLAVCLYSACRKERPCKVMLIDFADRLQVNVFKLGHCFKALHKKIHFAADGVMPILPEDLIFRFASKLEFGEKTEKVAQDAIRLVQRMSIDWMVMGRRPSGVCGACLILAARMNNFRRTITEVVYIVKVTTHTIQMRLDEFKLTPSSALTVDDFLNNEFLESAHDPPSFYRKSEEFLKNKKTRKRKHRELGEDEEDAEGSEGDEQNKRQRTADGQSASPTPDGPPQPQVELRRDADGFAIPPAPTQNNDPSPPTPPQSQTSTGSSHLQQLESELPIDPLLMPQVQKVAGISEEDLARDFGGEGAIPEAENEEDDDSPTSSSSGRGRRTEMVLPDSWLSAEHELELEISEIMNDTRSAEYAAQLARATEKADNYMLLVEQKNISMDVHIGEDEFADDPEVVNCLLPQEEMRKKEIIWVNENKSWLRDQQEKILKRKMAESAPPKATRKRKKKPRMGEGQTSVASSPAEAAISVLKERTWSKKINYDAVAEMFQRKDSALGSAATSRVTSRAASTVPESREGSVAPTVSESGAEQSVAETGAVGNRLLNELGEEDMEEEDDYDDPGMGDIDPMGEDPDDNFGHIDDDDYDYD